MDKVKSRSASLIANAPGRLYRALPAVALGTLFNVLDTVSTGLLLFPSEDGSGPSQFKALQIQGLSMYIMSTVLSQIAMTVGGSRFPGALGAMLIEILPFLRGVGSDICDALGRDNPALVPTVMVAYALTSFLTGFVFILLGALKLGYFVAYFPQTVLTGAIGAVGLSLFLLGLGLLLPESQTLSLLFTPSHLPLFAASLLPALFLSASKRSHILDRLTRGAVHNAYFIPGCLCAIPLIFWIVVGFINTSQETLITHGWLFRVEAQQTGTSTSWIYWREFDFPKVEWWALRHAVANIVLLVTIGVLNLPIFVPALAVSLDVSYDMNHEFLGQGAANLLAGMAGTVPNILQYSYSVFVTRANGGRFEMALVTILTSVLFFTSSLLLPYVPTVLASALVLFLGIELLLEAVWESAQTLVFLEWGVVVCTLLACTFFGFAEGFAVGIGTAAVVYLVYGALDSRARLMEWEEWSETHKHYHQEHVIPIPVSPLNRAPSAATLMSCYTHSSNPDIESTTSLVQNRADDLLLKLHARVVVLSGYVFFASIPSLETNLLDTKRQTSFVIVDLTLVHRLETAAAQCFERAVRDLAPRSTIMVLCGVQQGTGVHADFERAGVKLIFDAEDVGEKGILAFATRGDSLAWCQRQVKDAEVVEGSIDETGSISNAQIYESFCKSFGFDLESVLRTDGRDASAEEDHAVSPATLSSRTSDVGTFIDTGARFFCYSPGQTITRTGSDRIVFIVEGHAEVITSSTSTSTSSLSLSTSARPALSHVLTMIPRECLLFVKQRLFSGLLSFSSFLPFSFLSSSSSSSSSSSHKDKVKVGAGSVLDCSRRAEDRSISVLARSQCVTVEIESERVGREVMSWARGKVGEAYW